MTATSPARTRRTRRSRAGGRRRSSGATSLEHAPAAPAYLAETEAGWRPVSWHEAAARVEALAHGLLARGVGRGDAVAVLSRTRLEWILLDWAIMSVGAVVVGLYPTNSAKECAYMLEHSETVLAFAEDEEQEAKLVSIAAGAARRCAT